MQRSRLTAGAAAVAAMIACATNPATGKKQLMLVSEAQEIAMGKEADQEAVAAYGLYADPKVQAYVNALGQRLAAKSERPSLPWSFKVVDDPAVNAFALPGGYIYVTRGIMAHLRSEAELVAVVGHEIGHVTGRHSASQMSKQQLAMGGLVLGMAVVPELQRFGGLAQQGLGLLFLKFGRDDENQADELGLRYMTRVDYDPREMLEVFGVLDGVTRAEGGGARMPDWLSTHPSPGNRLARIQGQIAATGVSGTVVRRAEYLRRLDGMVFGENPREGFFRENAFYHPDLRFQLSFPRGFQTQNQKQAVVGVSEAQDAMIALTLAAGASAEEAARQFFSQQGVQAGRSGRDTIGGLPAYTAFFEAATEQGVLRGEVSFVSYDGKIYRILAYTPAARFSAYQNAFDAAIRSFSRLTDSRYLNVQPKRLELVNPDRQMGLPEFGRVYPSTVELGTIGLINGIGANQMFPRGELAKRVVGGLLPGGPLRLRCLERRGTRGPACSPVAASARASRTTRGSRTPGRSRPGPASGSCRRRSRPRPAGPPRRRRGRGTAG
jgi:predicted Zn-dependent protease